MAGRVSCILKNHVQCVTQCLETMSSVIKVRTCDHQHFFTGRQHTAGGFDKSSAVYNGAVDGRNFSRFGRWCGNSPPGIGSIRPDASGNRTGTDCPVNPQVRGIDSVGTNLKHDHFILSFEVTCTTVNQNAGDFKYFGRDLCYSTLCP